MVIVKHNGFRQELGYRQVKAFGEALQLVKVGHGFAPLQPAVSCGGYAQMLCKFRLRQVLAFPHAAQPFMHFHLDCHI